jgi:hypothetical protein
MCCLGAAANLALGKQAWQSSNWDDISVASKAVDGNTNTNWYGYSCCGTAPDDKDPWWAVDLSATYYVQEVVLFNRADCCGDYCSESF